MVRLICYNIEYCEGLKGHWYEYLKFWKIFFPPKNLDLKIINNLKKFNPDILALVEIDTGSFRAKKNEVKFFEKQLQLKSIANKIKYPFVSWMRLLYKLPIINKQSNAIISKYKLKNVKYHLLSEGVKRLVIQATVYCPRKVTLLLAHLALGEKTRKKQLNELIDLINSIKGEVILMGDFNTKNGKKELLNLIKKTHLQYRARLNHKSLTFPAYKPSKRFDYVLVSKGIRIKKYSVLHFDFSDHLPLFIDFDFKKTK